MTTSQPSSRDISRKLVALIFGANFFGALIIFLYFSVIDPLPVGGVAVRSLETEGIVTFGIAGVVIFVGAFVIISRLGRPIQNCLGVVIGDVRYFPPPILYPLLVIFGFLLLTVSCTSSNGSGSCMGNTQRCSW